MCINGKIYHLGFIGDGTIVSGSMMPEYQIGENVLYYKKDFSNIKVGDDICYQSYFFKDDNGNPKIIMHRVIETGVSKDGVKYVLTQGIANSMMDEQIVTEDSYIGNIIFKYHFDIVYFYLIVSCSAILILLLWYFLSKDKNQFSKI